MQHEPSDQGDNQAAQNLFTQSATEVSIISCNQ